MAIGVLAKLFNKPMQRTDVPAYYEIKKKNEEAFKKFMEGKGESPVSKALKVANDKSPGNFVQKPNFDRLMGNW